MRGLTITGGGVVWRNGIFRAPLGMDALGPNGYAAFVRGARNVTFVGATFTDAKKGLVIDKSEDVAVRNSRFFAVRDDGIIASATRRIEVTRNDFRDSQPHATTCTMASGTERRVSRRDCVARGGEWLDGSHADAVQMRDGIIGALIGWNRIEGDTQGIGQMDKKGDAPLADVKVVGNSLRVSMPHSITLGNCRNCSIIDNDVAPTAKWKTVLRFNPDQTLACGNKVANGGPGRDACRK